MSLILVTAGSLEPSPRKESYVLISDLLSEIKNPELGYLYSYFSGLCPVASLLLT